jgi:hypothetical protein
VADYGNDTSRRASVIQLHPSRPPGPAPVGVTTHETLRLLGLTFRTDASFLADISLKQATRTSLTGPPAQTAYCSGAATKRWWHPSEQK